MRTITLFHWTNFPVSELQGSRRQAIEIAPTFGDDCAAVVAGNGEIPCKFPQNRESDQRPVCAEKIAQPTSLLFLAFASGDSHIVLGLSSRSGVSCYRFGTIGLLQQFEFIIGQLDLKRRHHIIQKFGPRNAYERGGDPRLIHHPRISDRGH